jgi:cytochrome b561
VTAGLETSREYNGAAKFLHWLIVVLLVVQFAVAWTMPDIRRDTKPVDLVAWHLSVGMFVMLAMLTRLGWRAVSSVPPPASDLGPLLRRVSGVTHFVLYCLLFVLPLFGWMNANARGWTVRLFGSIPLPALVVPGSPLGRAMGDVHGIVAWVLLGAIGLHVLGALYHRLVLKDALLQSMLPRMGRS